MRACRLTENEHKKRQKVQKEKDEIGENRERIGPKITENTENNGKSASLCTGLSWHQPPTRTIHYITDTDRTRLLATVKPTSFPTTECSSSNTRMIHLCTALATFQMSTRFLKHTFRFTLNMIQHDHAKKACTYCDSTQRNLPNIVLKTPPMYLRVCYTCKFQRVTVSGSNKNTPSSHHPQRRNVTTTMDANR